MAESIRSAISDRAQTGFAKSNAYDSHRPSYSSSIVQKLLEETGVAGVRHAKLLDLAAGTGKFTECLAARDEQFQIIAVEPHADMRAVLETKKLPNVKIVDGTAESMGAVGDGSLDAVFVAQGFHWFANMTALKEIHRVLARHGALGLVWNVEDYNNARDHEASTVWEAKLHDLVWQVVGEVGDEAPRFRNLEWRKVFDEQVKKTPLSLILASDDQLFSLPIAEYTETFEVALSVESLWERYSTLGHIAALQSEHLDRVYKHFLEAVSEAEKNENDEVLVHGNTYAAWTTKIPAEGRTGEEALEDLEREQE